MVHGAFVRFPGLLFELKFSPHQDEVLAVKIEIDTNSPAGASLDISLVPRHVLLNLYHHDRASLLAGKLHAILQRSFLKDHDVWYSIVETVADGVTPHRPEWVVQISLKHAECLMSGVKSKNCPIVAAWLKRAKKAYWLLRKTDEWRRCLGKTKEKYKRKPALQN